MLKNTRKKRRITAVPEENNIHKSLRFILVIAQIFGFCPVQGVLSSNIESLGFSWCSLKILSATFTSTGGFLVALAHLNYIILTGYQQNKMDGFIFYTCGTLSCLFFIKLATEWKSIVSKWKEIDLMLAAYEWPKQLNKKLKLISIIFLVLETVEHFSHQIYKLIEAIQCKESVSKGFDHFTANMSFPVVFDVIKPFYATWLGIIFHMVKTKITFSRTFIDLFIMLISCALAMRFKQINHRIRCLRDMKVQSERTWCSINEEYNGLCRLVAFLDDKMSFLILISFFHNFYFILFKIFDSLSLYTYETLDKVFYFLSLSLLILRTISVCLYASWINEESKKSIEFLSTTSYEIYNKEILRFLESVNYQSVGLTGKQFFRITRPLVLKIAGAVITYEIVIIQFNKNLQKTDELSKNLLC